MFILDRVLPPVTTAANRLFSIFSGYDTKLPVSPRKECVLTAAIMNMRSAAHTMLKVFKRFQFQFQVHLFKKQQLAEIFSEFRAVFVLHAGHG